MTALSDRGSLLRRTFAQRNRGRRGSVRLRRTETIFLLLVALVLAVATIYDLSRQVGIDNRLHADLMSWQAITGERYTHAVVELDAKHYTTRDVVCGWLPRVDPRTRAMECLIFTGPVHGWSRLATGGYYVVGTGPAKGRKASDQARYRFGCFGDAAAQGFKCKLSPSRAPHLSVTALRAATPPL